MKERKDNDRRLKIYWSLQEWLNSIYPTCLKWLILTLVFVLLIGLDKDTNITVTDAFTSICNELFTWADVYDTANHDERRAILQQFIKKIRVRKDYEISITLNASFNQVEQLKAVSTYDGAEIFEEISEKGA